MATQLDTSPLAYQISSFILNNKPRFIVQRRDTLEPSRALSVYEQYLNHKTDSHYSKNTILKNLLYLFTWALVEGYDIESLLLNGQLLDQVQIRKFAHWLRCRGALNDKNEAPLSVSGFNKALMYASHLICYFARQYGDVALSSLSLNEKENLINAQKKLFAYAKKKERGVKFAPDLTEEEIYSIDQFLNPANRKDVSPAVATRDFLIWRISIEFGMRIGEILALRLGDCPHKGQDYFRIVRIEERGPKYFDPRGANAPRPKTLSRDLGFLFKSPIPKLINEYTTEYRYKMVDRVGKQTKQFYLNHDFLIVSKKGEPLPVSTLENVAQLISKITGVAFHWHLARHAFFNRAYASIAAIEDRDDWKVKLMDLVYWGGWSDENSLQIYINRARQIRGQKALMLWQKGGNEWSAIGI